MRCAQVNRRVEGFADGSLDTRLEQEVEAHLLSCTRCRARVDAARAVLAGLGSPTERAPEGFAARVMEVVYRETLPEGRPCAQESRETRPALMPAQRIYRRLALSMLLAAGVLAASLCVPRAGYPGLLGSGFVAAGLSGESAAAAASSGLGAAVQSALDDADSAVRGILRDQANGGSER